MRIVTVPHWMHGIAKATAIALTLAVSWPALAAECGGNLNQIELNRCFDRVYRRADAELNAVYRHLAGNLGNDAEGKVYVDLLQAAERAWVAFRDQECEFETAVTRGGSIHPMEVSICLARLTRERSKELQRQLSCPEGDLSCVR